MKYLIPALALLTGLSLAHARDVDSFAELQKLFADPPSEYSTAPFFVWNGDMTEADIDRMLGDYRSQGIKSLFIHPRPGLITSYLSNRWFELVRYTVDQGKKLGMQVWLYDENSYPSGFAGGHVPAEMPESYNQGQGLTPKKLTDPAEASKCKVLLRKMGNAYYVAKAVTGDDEYVCFETTFFEKRAWHGGFSYVDLLKPGVTEKFIEITMRGYEKTLGGEFGRTVPGIFTDEPHVDAPTRNAMRWTPDLFEQFEKRWGYDLQPHLMSLFEQTGDWRRVRHNYYALILDLFIERWSKPWYRYAESKNLKWTGHYWEHSWPNIAHGPDSMAMYAWHHVPAIDMLFNQFRDDVQAQFGNVRSVKELSSVANQLGRRRTLSETYGGAGWELRFEDMKRLGEWQAVLGVNLNNQHLSHMTLVGSRKYDYPQSFTYHTPYWKHYRASAEYFARISLAMAAGEQRNRILVIEPSTTMWLYNKRGAADPLLMQMGNEFQSFLNQLEAMQVEYDLGSEKIMADHGKASAGKFTVGQRTYDLIVIPPATQNFNSATLKLLEAYANSGGKVFAFAFPGHVDGVQRDVDTSKWVRVSNVHDLANSDFSQVSGKLFHQRRHLEDGQLLYFVNSSLEAPARAVVKSPEPALTQLDPATGKMFAYPSNTGGTFTVDLAPGGSLLLMAGTKASPNPVPPAFDSGGAVAPKLPLSVKRLSPNALRIDYCDLDIGGRVERDVYFHKAQEAVFKHFGLGTNPWNTAVQYKTSIVDRNKSIPAGGFKATFAFDADAAVDRSTLKAVVEQPSLWNVAVNGKPVAAEPGSWWLDVRFGTYAIGKHVVAGRNTITVEATQMTVFHELEPVFVTGEFSLAPQDRGWKLASPGTLAVGWWNSQNLASYHDRVAYSTRYSLKRGGRYAVQLGKWNGTVAEVLVNGKSAGLIYAQPYRLEITDSIAPGDNRVEVVVYGSLKNLLGPHHGKINRGLTGPGSFRTAPEHMPPGNSYNVEEYGLFEPFSVVQSTAPLRSSR